MTETDRPARRAVDGDRSMLVTRAVALDDIQILSRAKGGGDGRTVLAYAAVFNTPTEIVDRDGHYKEQNAATAFNRSIAQRGPTDPERGGGSIFSVYNHAKDLAGQPSDLWSVPVGVPLEIKPDSRGLLTVTRYNIDPDSERILEAIKSGSLRGMSYTGIFVRSDPPAGPYYPDAAGDLPLVTRQEIALIEYGPTPIPAFEQAVVVGVRNREVIHMSGHDDAERAAQPAAAGEPDEDDMMNGRAGSVDSSPWDAARAWANGAAASDPAAFYRGICAGERAGGDPGTQAHWALPHHYHPGDAPNAAGVSAALGRLGATTGLANAAAARAHLEAHDRAIHNTAASSSAGRAPDEGTAERADAGEAHPDTSGGDAAPTTSPAANGTEPGERDHSRPAGPRQHPARTSPDQTRRGIMTDNAAGRLTVEERHARQEDISVRLQEIDAEFMGGELTADRQQEWDALNTEFATHARAIIAAEQRQLQLERLAQNRNAGINGAGSSPYGDDDSAGSVGVMERRGGPALIGATSGRGAFTYDVLEIRRNVATESLPAAYRDNAMRAVERARFPGTQDREGAQSRCEYLLNTIDDEDGTLARRMLTTGSPVYMRAFGKAVAKLSTAGLTQEESRALNMGSPGSAGGYAVPFQLDPTVILTSDGALNPLRQICRVEQIVGKTWEGVTSAGITVSRANEAAEASDGAPALAQPSVTPTRVHAFVPFSIEVEQDWNALQAEMVRLLADAKDIEEATSFVTGAGTGNVPQGIVTGIGTAQPPVVLTAATATLAVGDLYSVMDTLAPRWQPRARWIGSLTAFNAYRQLLTAVTSASGDQWVRPSQGNPAELYGYPAHYASAMSTTPSTTGQKPFILGDFNQHLIVDRLGMNVELVPHLFGTANNFPTGQRGIYAIWRNSSLTLVPSAFAMLEVL
jgi:HK97 family phage major capsid protein